MPAFALAPLTPWIATAGFGWLYYRRIRRQFGRQVYRPKRTLLRLCILALVSCGLLFAAVTLPRLLPGLAIGAVAGIGLGWLALRHTRVACIGGVREYTPNPWIGGLLSVLLIGRLVWRWHDGAFAAGAQQLGEQASPLTFGFLATLSRITWSVASDWRRGCAHWRATLRQSPFRHPIPTDRFRKRCVVFSNDAVWPA